MEKEMDEIKKIERVIEINLEPLKKAYATLEKFSTNSNTEQEQAGTIQAFEFCYELSWKMIKRVLYMEGIEVNSPRGAFREAARNGMIEDVSLWFNFLEKRNKTVHTYNELILKEILEVIPKFKSELGCLINLLEAKIIASDNK
jgi:nucleotidyltransferase substrate binding protein (TIGR01987 family)